MQGETYSERRGGYFYWNIYIFNSTNIYIVTVREIKT